MKNDNNPDEQPLYTGKAYAYIAIGLTAAAAVFFGLTFTILGIYALIASVLLGIAALSFVNVQKRKNDFKQLVIIRVCAYIVLGVDMAILIGGIIWSVTN